MQTPSLNAPGSTFSRLLPGVFDPTFWKRTWNDILLVIRLMGDSGVPLWLKILPVLVAVYLISPLDLIPGFLPVIGQLDDLGVLVMGLALFIRLAPDEAIARQRKTEDGE